MSLTIKAPIEKVINIYTVADLNAVRSNLAGSYILMNDLDLYNTTKHWLPIGTNSSPFTGSFDGNSYEISNLRIDTSKLGNGLFGATDSASIDNLGIVNVSIKTGGQTGSLIGEAYDTKISNCYATGHIATIKGSNVIGGLIGGITGSTIVNNSYASVNIDFLEFSSSNVGALIGAATSSSVKPSFINNCYSTGNINGNEKANIQYSELCGGLIGWAEGCRISTTYATGNVLVANQKHGAETSFFGGLAGFFTGTPTVNITNTLSFGDVAAESKVGGLVGEGTKINKSNNYRYALQNIVCYSKCTPNPSGALVNMQSLHSADFYKINLKMASANWQYPAINVLCFPKLRNAKTGNVLRSQVDNIIDKKLY